MNNEEVIVYIDEETDDGMMWEELNQTGKMQVEVYDEEYNDWVEYIHSIRVKSLQEYLVEHEKQVRKEVVQEISRKIAMIANRQPNHDIGFDCEDIQISYLEVASILNGIEQGE